MTSLNRIASWVLRNKTTKEVVCETFNPIDVMWLNINKYEAIPILDYLQELNREIAKNDLKKALKEI